MRVLSASSRIFNRRTINKNDNLQRLLNSAFTTTSNRDNNNNNKQSQSSSSDADADTTLLYRRRPSGANFPRAILTFSTLHTGYWSWYVFEFTPFVQQIASTTVDATATATVAATVPDNTIGYLGLGLAIFMSIGSVIFPKSLIQEVQLVNKSKGESGGGEKVEALPSSSSLRVRTYGLPFITPSPPTNYPMGDIILDSPNDIKMVITEYGGDISYFSGYLPVHVQGKKINLLLQLTDATNKKNKDTQQNDSEIYDKDLLFKTLVPSTLSSVLHNESSHNKVSDGGKRRADVLSKKQKMMERRMLRRK